MRADTAGGVGPPAGRVVGEAGRHEERAEVGVAEAEGPLAEGVLGDHGADGEVGHVDGDLQDQRPQGNGVRETGHVERALA
jgi:hypothetical protein